MDIVFLGAANPETGRMIKAVEQCQPNFNVIGFLDNDPKKKGNIFLNYPVLGGFEILDTLVNENIYFVNLITGSTKTRYETSRFMASKGCRFANFIHPTVNLLMTHIGVGNYIQEGVILQAETHIGNNSSIHIASLIGHESTIGDSVFIAHGCSISGLVEIGDGAFLGTHATVLPRLKIGKWSTIGAGAVIIRDIPDYAVAVGNPAKIIKYSNPMPQNGNIFSMDDA